MHSNKPNPLTAEPNPYKEYNKNRDEHVKNNPEIQEVARLCYEVFFKHPDGKKLMEIYEERFLHSTLVNPLMKNPSETALYWTGFTDCIKGFKNYVAEHQRMINSLSKD